MKKTFLSLMALVLSLGTLQGCSNNNDHGLDPDHPVAITVWNYYNGSQKAAFDGLVDEFNQTIGKEKGIIVEATSMGSIDNIHDEVTKSLNKEVNALDLPDIFSTYADTAEEINSRKQLVSLKDYMSEEDLNQYFKTYLEEGRIYKDEDIKIFPVAKASEVLILNKTAWDAFAKDTGADIKQLTTWEGLCDISEKYYNYAHKAFFGRDALMNYLLTGSAQLGSPLFTIDEKTAQFSVHKDVMRKLWDNYYLPYISGYFTKKGKFASDDFKTLDIIASVSSSAGASFFPKEVMMDGKMTPIEYKVLSIPNFKGTSPYAISQGAGMAIVKSEEAKEYASICFLKWLSEPDQNIVFAAENSYLPVTKDGNNTSTWKKTIKKHNIKLNSLVSDTIEVSMEQVNNSTLYTSLNYTNSYSTRNYLEKSLLNIAENDRVSVEKALQQGASLQDALAPYQSDSYFDAWFDSVSKDIQQILKGQQ